MLLPLMTLGLASGALAAQLNVYTDADCANFAFSLIVDDDLNPSQCGSNLEGIVGYLLVDAPTCSGFNFYGNGDSDCTKNTNQLTSITEMCPGDGVESQVGECKSFPEFDIQFWDFTVFFDPPGTEPAACIR